MKSITNYMKRYPIYILFFIHLIIFSSCEKVVTVDLNTATPQMVIEGTVSDQSGPNTVKISKTTSYFDPSIDITHISNALVIITDDHGTIDTLKEISKGSYSSSLLQGMQSRTYSLKVVTEGKEYRAMTYMPPKILIDSMYSTILMRGGQRGYYLYVLFKDPPETRNYYRLNFTVSTSLPIDSLNQRSYRLYTDKFTNGLEESYRIRIGRNVNPGDTVKVQLYSIDKQTYDYYNTMNDVLSAARSPVSLAPANPNTNLNNGALGFFAAYSVDTKYFILQ